MEPSWRFVDKNNDFTLNWTSKSFVIYKRFLTCGSLAKNIILTMDIKSLGNETLFEVSEIRYK